MGNHNLSLDSLNRAIDEVAARMTAVDAPADLGARVIARIDERRSPVWMWALKPIAAVAAVAVVAMAVPRIRTPGSVASSQPTAARVATSATTDSAVVTAVDRVRLPAARVATTPARPRMSAAEAAWHARAIPALDGIAALSIDGIQPEALSIPQLEVKALATAPLVVPADGKGMR